MTSKSTRIWTIGAIVFVALILVLVKNADRFLDKEALRLSIQKGLTESTGTQFTIKELTLESTLVHGIQAHLNTTTIRDMKGHPLGDVRNITVQIRYLPLITSRTPEIAKVHLNGVYLPVANESLFNQLALKIQPPKEDGFIKPARMVNAEILLTDYLIEDFQLPSDVKHLYPQARRFWVSGDELSVKHLMSNEPVSISAKGDMDYWASQGERRQAKADPKQQINLGQYNLLVELPQRLFRESDDPNQKKKEFSIRDLERVRFEMKSQTVPFLITYQKENQQLAHIDLDSDWTDLERAESLIFQMADTMSLPIPPEAKSLYLAGRGHFDSRIDLHFPVEEREATRNAQIEEHKDVEGIKVSTAGFVDLKDAALATPESYPRYMVSHLNGRINLAEQALNFKALSAEVGKLRLMADGRLNWGNQTLNGRVYGNNVPIRSLAQTMRDLGASPATLQGGDFSGRVSPDITVQGDLKNIAYRGTLAIADGKYTDPRRGVNAPSINGRIALNGILQPDAKTFAMPNYTGNIDIANARYKDAQTGLLVDRIGGRLLLANRITLQGFKGYLGSTPFAANGFVGHDLKNYQVRVTANNVNLAKVKTEVLSKMKDDSGMIAALDPYQGTANLNLLASTGGRLNGQVLLNNVALRTGTEGEDLRIPLLTVNINNSKISIPTTNIYYGDVALALSGSFNNGRYNVAFNSQSVPLAFIRDNSDLIAAFSGITVPEIWNTAGSVAIDGKASNTSTQLSMIFNNAGLSWQGGDFPIYEMNGKLYYSQKPGGQPVIATRDLTLRYGNSPVAVDASQQGAMQVRANGVLSKLAVNHFLNRPQAVGMPYERIPFQVAMSGAMGAFGPDESIKGQKPLQLTTDVFLNLDPTLQAEPSEGKAAVSEMPPATEPLAGEDYRVPGGNQNRPPVPDAPDLKQNPLLALEAREASEELGQPISAATSDSYIQARIELVGDDVTVPTAALHLGESGDLQVTGQMKDVADPEGRNTFSAHVLTTPEINLSELSRHTRNDVFQDMKGTFTTDLQLSGGSGVVETAAGWLNMTGVAIPKLTIEDLTGRVDIDGQLATANIATFKIPGIETGFTGQTRELGTAPVPLENVTIHGKLFSLAAMTDFQNNIVKPILVDRLLARFIPAQPGAESGLMPVRFQNADLSFDEVIYQNIILEHVHGSMLLGSRGYIALKDINLEAAGGKAVAQLTLNPRQNNLMTATLDIQDTSANALTRALLNVTNQVFGTVNGKIQFTTFGKTDKDMIDNALGTANISVKDGRLPAIARVETLLSAANVLRGGLLGLNLNNILRTLHVTDDDYFAELSGDFKVAEGVLYTNNTLSDGQDLDLLVQGTIGMQNGATNVLVNGVMNQDVSSGFGVIGKLSLGKLVSFIPGIGTFGGKRSGLLGYLPGVGYVPGLGGPAGETNRFSVRLVGDTEDPASIQDFHWVSDSDFQASTDNSAGF